MQFPILAVLSLAAGSYAALHNAAVCVSGKLSAPVGGSAWSVSYNWQTSYEVLSEATKCACDYYRQRNTGDNQWDQCPDCSFADGLACKSAGKHIGGDEMYYYCTEKCGAEGSEAD